MHTQHSAFVFNNALKAKGGMGHVSQQKKPFHNSHVLKKQFHISLKIILVYPQGSECCLGIAFVLIRPGVKVHIWHEISYFLKWKNYLSSSVTYFLVSCFYNLFPRYFNLFDM